MTGLPAAFSALALASTASVADSEMADTRAETLLGMRSILPSAPSALRIIYHPAPGGSTEGRFGRTLHEPAAGLSLRQRAHEPVGA
jgi:hypothetical protein